MFLIEVLLATALCKPKNGNNSISDVTITVKFLNCLGRVKNSQIVIS